MSRDSQFSVRIILNCIGYALLRSLIGPEQIRYKIRNQSRLDHSRFPTQSLVIALHFEFSLIPWDVFLSFDWPSWLLWFLSANFQDSANQLEGKTVHCIQVDDDDERSSSHGQGQHTFEQTLMSFFGFFLQIKWLDAIFWRRRSSDSCESS